MFWKNVLYDTDLVDGLMWLRYENLCDLQHGVIFFFLFANQF